MKIKQVQIKITIELNETYLSHINILAISLARLR